MVAIRNECDVVVIGGGPAGATAATLIAQKGVDVQLFERDHFPRFHVGESLVPETYWVLNRLGMIDKLHKSPFVRKHSVQFVNAMGKLSAPFYFTDHKPHESSKTWQVVRSEFDLMMLRNAAEHGAHVHEGVRVQDVLLEGEKAVGVKLLREDGTPHEVRCKVVIDASGQSAIMMNRFKLRIWDPILNKGAIWTYWKGAYRDAGKDEGCTLVMQTGNKVGWFWYIPLHDDRISIGVVAPFDYLFKNRTGHEQTFLDEVEATPHVKERLATGERCSGYFATRDFSYRATKVAGDGWIIIGDAFGFLDPLYSSGVLLALKGGELAADATVDAIAAGDVSEAKLGHWGPAFSDGIDRMRRLVCEYYDGFNFGSFIRQNPEQKGTLIDLLIGDMFTEKTDALWKPMEAMYAEGKSIPVAWNECQKAVDESIKCNELTLPTGPKP